METRFHPASAILLTTMLTAMLYSVWPQISNAHPYTEATPFVGVQLGPHRGEQTSASAPGRSEAAGQPQNHSNQTVATSEGRPAQPLPQRRRVSEEDELQPYLEPPAYLYFRFDSAELENYWYGAVGRIADTLQEHPQLHIVLVGHTDLGGSPDYNRYLSERRAAHVAELLMTDFAIPKDRIRVHGAGADDPLVKSASPAINAKNRRVEVLFTQR